MQHLTLQFRNSEDFVSVDSEEQLEAENAEDDAEEVIKKRTDIGPTYKWELSRARRGQGSFKRNVCSYETGCRVTGVKELMHLRASHIKPWVKSTDEEKLSGCNGLLLAPHIDHLFDEGWISFEDNRGGSGWLDSLFPFLSGASRVADYAAVSRVVRLS
jgi:predicted restriction endonuclease